MPDTPFREPPPGTKRHYWRIDPDMTDEDAWAEHFVDAVLGEAVEPESDHGDTLTSARAGSWML